MPRRRRGPTVSRAVAIVVVAVVTVLVAVAAVLAFQHARPSGTAATAAPVPTFSLGVDVGSPATPSPTATTPPSAGDRFLTVGSDALWRATAGRCGVTEPRVERSTDGGSSWTDITPRYKGIAQVGALDPLGDSAAQMVAALGEKCDVEGIRTFTRGRFWEPNKDVIAPARYIDFHDAGVVVTPGGEIAAPCASAHGLRATGPVVALVCGKTAYVVTGDSWTKLPATRVAAVAVSSGTVIVAHDGNQCRGLTLTEYPEGHPSAGNMVGCAVDADAGKQTAIAVGGDGGIYVWSGESFELVRP
ncbi:hypothetical protein GH740_07450 [Microbacterium sp. SYP-A9085]|uniref:hypothetical protein n=1 Tax=Microbacterium sp. SYP-A9085 TaxID=2664454 RepID=UPI00129B8512|nr:hypothetical protein [Microbacterium sp. SYP-A9085]MRH29150.1 hypothetical protein [Microbacterium sp. SYP-A9085]